MTDCIAETRLPLLFLLELDLNDNSQGRFPFGEKQSGVRFEDFTAGSGCFAKDNWTELDWTGLDWTMVQLRVEPIIRVMMSNTSVWLYISQSKSRWPPDPKILRKESHLKKKLWQQEKYKMYNYQLVEDSDYLSFI